MTISLFATKSMQAIDDWLKVCQGNLTGSTRTAFKESIIMYLGGIVDIDKVPTNKAYGKMMAEQALSTGYTRLDWRQGEIVSSTQNTHFAIQGEGFFLVVDPKIRIDLNNPVHSNPMPTTGVYLTRDGEFSWRIGSEINPNLNQNELYLVTKEGLLVLGDIQIEGTPNSSGNSNNRYFPIMKTVFDIETPSPIFPFMPYRVRPSIVQPTRETNNAAAPTTAFDYDLLRFSKYGSTVFSTEGVLSVKNYSKWNSWGT
ncbi:MAG: hypothetical protein KatS3mg068_0363 [Candidatus Sericytochromatia bacterium]|nr:MAG: hypothetical protein KatS3mg068_0363 [Candidatus Sericytochromatia bacterium]